MELSDNSVHESIDHLFRQHAGQMVSILTRIFGFEKIDLIEDAVQDSLVAALRTWSYAGIPDNPRAWLVQVSKNRILDRLRFNKKFDWVENEEFEHAFETFDSQSSAKFENELAEDQLRMIFACCHPAIPADSRVALTLRTVGGFRIFEIARAFLASDDAISKMLVRAKQTLRRDQVKLEIPPPDEIPSRLATVLKVLYLMFNEGYSASVGDELTRRGLCFEAIRLAELLASHSVTASPAADALTALFLFQAARFSSRCDVEGELLLLSEQDRSMWDRKILARAAFYFHRSARGDELTDYHLEAEIAACHAFAADFESTDWRAILACYDMMQRRKFSPVVELNRIIVLSKIEGVDQALAALDRLQRDHKIKHYNLYHTTRAKFLAQSGRWSEALNAYHEALDLTQNEKIRAFINRQIVEIGYSPIV